MSEQKIFRNYICTPSDKDLDRLLKNNQNVLLIGEAGVGKTARMVSCVQRNKVKYKYFSAPTMDPFLDLRGIPKEVSIEGKSALDFIMPKHMTDDVEVFIFDEMNRAHKSVMASIMELLQFKSINGHKFPKLRAIWGAINPHTEDGRYQVEELDPAIRDRFQAIMEVEYVTDRAFFRNKFGKIGDCGCDWWRGLSLEQRRLCSPRRLEYALTAATCGSQMDIKMFIPIDCQPDKLINIIENGSPRELLYNAIKKHETETIRKIVNDENSFEDVKDIIVDNKEEVLPLLKEERATALLAENASVRTHVFDSVNKDKYIDLIKVLQNSTNMQIKQLADNSISNSAFITKKKIDEIKKRQGII